MGVRAFAPLMPIWAPKPLSTVLIRERKKVLYATLVRVYQDDMSEVVRDVSILVDAHLRQNAAPKTTPERKLNIAEARESLTAIVNEVAYGGQRMIVMRRGKELAALIPITDLETLRSIPVPIAACVQVRQGAADSFIFTVPSSTAPVISEQEK
jgi:prevent-host-death family protein